MDRFGLKVVMYPTFMKFGTQNKSNVLVIKILIGIAKFGPKIEMCSNFHEIGTQDIFKILLIK